jgi:hypothetical protein
MPGFRTLPAELRIEIWKFTMLPRNVRLVLKLDGPPHIPAGGPQHRRIPQISLSASFRQNITRIVSYAPLPVTLHVCHESRSEALKKYEMCFSARDSPGRTWVNWTLDTTVMDSMVSWIPKVNINPVAGYTASKQARKPSWLMSSPKSNTLLSPWTAQKNASGGIA